MSSKPEVTAKQAMAALDIISPQGTEHAAFARRIVYGLPRGTVYTLTTPDGRRHRLTARKINALASALPALTNAPEAKHGAAAGRMVADMEGGAL